MFEEHALRDGAALLALAEAASAVKLAWYQVADLVEVAGSAMAIVGGDARFFDGRDTAIARALARQLSAEVVDTCEARLRKAVDDGRTTFVTVLDPSYPANLRHVYNRPPFLFLRGALRPEDERAVAVVGGRRASPEGRSTARSFATELVHRRVTVVSGWGNPIDSETHTAALDGHGRALAVLGSGMGGVEPGELGPLAEKVASAGALVSPLPPGAPHGDETEPFRHVVTSGIAQATVVVEGPEGSGAHRQGRTALDHGRRLFVVDRLVRDEPWARDFADRSGVTVVTTVDEVLAALDADVVAATRKRPPFV